MVLKSARIVDFKGQSSGFADFAKQGIADHLRISWHGLRIVPILKIGSWFLNEIQIIDLSSALVGKLMSLSKLFIFLFFIPFFSNEAHSNSGVLPSLLFARN